MTLQELAVCGFHLGAGSEAPEKVAGKGEQNEAEVSLTATLRVAERKPLAVTKASRLAGLGESYRFPVECSGEGLLLILA